MKRRTFIVVGASTTALAGCIGNGDDEQDELSASVEADNGTPTSDGRIRVTDQEGQGEQVLVESVEANVPFIIYIEYGNTKFVTGENEAGQYSESEFFLDQRITDETTINMELRTTSDDTVLDSASFMYIPVPLGPEMSTENAEDIFRGAAPFTGTQRRPWRNFSAWGRPDDGTVAEVESHVDGWEPTVFWEAEATMMMNDLELRIDSINLRMFREMFESDYEVRSVSAEVWFFDDDIRDTSHISTTTMTADEAGSVNWERELDDPYLRTGMSELVSDHSFDSSVWDGDE